MAGVTEKHFPCGTVRIKGSRVDFNLDLGMILYKDGNSWIAQGLELDLASFGSTLQEASEALVEAVAAWMRDIIRNGAWENLRRQAPQEFWRMAESAVRLPDLRVREDQLPEAKAFFFSVKTTDARQTA